MNPRVTRPCLQAVLDLFCLAGIGSDSKKLSAEQHASSRADQMTRMGTHILDPPMAAILGHLILLGSTICSDHWRA